MAHDEAIQLLLIGSAELDPVLAVDAEGNESSSPIGVVLGVGSLERA